MLQEALAFLRTRKKMNLLMAAANVLVFAVLSLLGNTESAAFMAAHGAAYSPLIAQGQYWRLFTAMFLHFGLIHLVYNMICLIALGDMLETMVGPIRYLIIYLLGGLAGNVLSWQLDLRSGAWVVSAGASGAIFAVIGGVLYLTLRRRHPAAAAMRRRMLLMTVLMIAQGFTEGGTDNAAHIGGLIAGFVLTWLLTMRDR